MPRRLLVLDSSYGYEAIRKRQLEDSVTCRDLGGFFEHVWTVHPFASLVSEGETAKHGVPESHRLNDAHTFVDGKVGRFDALASLFPLNFLASQTDLVARLSMLIRREKISAIRVGDPLYNGLIGLALARANGIPLVVRVNANYDKIHEATGKPMMPRFFRSYAVEKRIVRYVLSRADLVAAVNQDNLDYAIANGARPARGTIFRYGNLLDKRHVAPPAMRLFDDALLAEFWTPPYRFLICVGRLETVKHPDDVIRVLAETRQRGFSDLKLLMVGDGQERGILDALAEELGVREHVAFCGNRSQDWLAQMFPRAAAVVSPITGRALSEAAFGEAPIVAYDLDWQSELIETGKTGELVPARDVRSAADATARLLADPAYARRLGAAARERAFEMLDPERLDEHERSEYRKLLG